MRTYQEFRKQMIEAHDCKKCHGKLFCISKDNLGNSRCAYCNQIVKYPKATKEELAFWITMIEDKKLFEELAKK